MNFNFTNKFDQDKARNYLDYLIETKARSEITKKKRSRTLSQNNYLHLILKYYATQVGDTAYEAKQFYKQLNNDYYFYEKGDMTYCRSSRNIDKATMARSIDRFIKYAESNGYDIPKADNMEHIDHAVNEIEIHSNYL